MRNRVALVTVLLFVALLFALYILKTEKPSQSTINTRTYTTSPTKIAEFTIPKYISNEPGVATNGACYFFLNSKEGLAPGLEYLGGNSWNDPQGRDITVCAGAFGGEPYKGLLVVGGHTTTPGDISPNYDFKKYRSPKDTGILYIVKVNNHIVTLVSKSGNYPLFVDTAGMSSGNIEFTKDHYYYFNLDTRQWVDL